MKDYIEWLRLSEFDRNFEEFKEKGFTLYSGFIVEIKIIGDIVKLTFPHGYEPDGNKINEVHEKFIKFIGEETIKIDKNSFEIKINNQKMAFVLIDWFRDNVFYI